MKRGFKIGAAIAAVGAIGASAVVAVPLISSASPSHQAGPLADTAPPAGTGPVTIPTNSSPRTLQCRNGYVALTFDDGPTKVTPKLLAVLRKIGAKATFFDVGAHARQYPNLVKEQTYAGWVGNHSYSHPHLVALGEPGAFNELLGTNQLLKHITGQTPTLFRPPFDNINYQVDFDARDLGMTSVIWTTDSYDWTGASTAKIVANAERVPPGGIILFHDGYTNTLDALPEIVDNLASRGLCAGEIVPSADPIVTSFGQTFYATVVHW
jgi:peptidoglycan/xylan/chitin deacetylase (PgdA/CDA1 family)